MQIIQFDTINTITIKELVRLIDLHDISNNPVPFDLIAITCNYSKNEGGEIVILSDVIQYRNARIKEVKLDVFDNISVTPYIPKIAPKLAERVRRFYCEKDDSIRNANIRYITHFKQSTQDKFKRIVY
ncbi:hypothetical protein LV89_01990 [Arcicella aurantiaca]|uniref:Uncharacterized protein n=1 Tax=Arcicella aurantiaca TaxID=591202 RepID=A0A316ECS6_9BACT|nr:hypothetical protein [Arcicella aurantiaca]PWK27175.1 hypothetical protein LV89_01990 [Arcicella aurantiaca]